MTAAAWVFVGLAAGYVVLALYGKYRTIKAEFYEEREREAAGRAEPEDEPLT